jgi:pyrroline-5-carboxylate reductase
MHKASHECAKLCRGNHIAVIEKLMTGTVMSNRNLTIGFIGGGNMAQAIIRGLVKAGHPAENISIADPAIAQRTAIAAIDTGLFVTSDNSIVARNAQALVLAVKPQVMAEVAIHLGQQTRPSRQVIVSVAAGIRLDSLRDWFGKRAAIVRVMPNQPALIGKGMSGLCATAEVGTAGRATVDYLLCATGKSVWFNDESLMDCVTALSGSGPAYFYLIMEIMQDVAIELGFDHPTARLLSTQTALGAAGVAADTDEDLALLRERVTSPGGTTAAALQVLESSGLRVIFRNALLAARDRAIELGQPGKGN